MCAVTQPGFFSDWQMSASGIDISGHPDPLAEAGYLPSSMDSVVLPQTCVAQTRLCATLDYWGCQFHVGVDHSGMTRRLSQRCRKVTSIQYRLREGGRRGCEPRLSHLHALLVFYLLCELGVSSLSFLSSMILSL